MPIEQELLLYGVALVAGVLAIVLGSWDLMSQAALRRATHMEQCIHGSQCIHPNHVHL